MVINTNEMVTIERQRFTIIHELAHLIAHQDVFGSDYNTMGKGRSRDDREIYADAFAGAFLVPAEELERLIRIVSDKIMIDNKTMIMQIKRYFGVSYQTILLRLKNIGYFSNERQFGIIYGKLKNLYGPREPQPITTPLEFKNPKVFTAIDFTFD